MKRIAVIGANGRVGAEVCLFLKEVGQYEPVPISRTETGASFLRSMGLIVKVGSPLTDGIRLLEGTDLVADFSNPAGNLKEAMKASSALIEAVTLAAPKGVPFVYASSTRAFGDSPNERGHQTRWIPRTPYARLKRHGESVARRACRRSKRPVYPLRIGQVLGAIQDKSKIINKGFRGPVAIVDGLSDTIFAYSLAEALGRIADTAPDQLTYTLVSEPQWSWLEVHEFHRHRAGAGPQEIQMVPPPRERPASFRRIPLRAVNPTVSSFAASLGFLSGHLERYAVARVRLARATAEIGELLQRERKGPYDQEHLGPVPGPRLSLDDARYTMPSHLDRVERLLRESTGPRAARTSHHGR